MTYEIFIAYIPLTFAIIIMIYSSAFETSMPYSVYVLLGMSCIMLVMLSMLILFGVILWKQLQVFMVVIHIFSKW